MLTTVYSFNDGTLSTVVPYSALIGYTMYTVSIPEDLNPSVFPNGDITFSPDNCIFDIEFEECVKLSNDTFIISYFDDNNNLISREIRPTRKQILMPAEEIM